MDNSRLARAFIECKRFFTTGALAGFDSSQPGQLESDLLWALRHETGYSMEDAIDLLDELNLRQVLRVNEAGQFFFNEAYAEVAALEA